jgi:hypothetical protein
MSKKPDNERIDTLAKALVLIEANPDHWDQGSWHCNTSHCFAGFCDIVLDRQLKRSSLKDIRYSENASMFALANPDLGYLFTHDNTLDYLQQEVAYLLRSGTISGFDSEGLNEAGYEESDYDVDGNLIDITDLEEKEAG